MKQSNNYQNIYLENQYKYEQKGVTNTVQKMKFSIKVFFSKCDLIRSFLRFGHIYRRYP